MHLYTRCLYEKKAALMLGSNLPDQPMLPSSRPAVSLIENFACSMGNIELHVRAREPFRICGYRVRSLTSEQGMLPSMSSVRY